MQALTPQPGSSGLSGKGRCAPDLSPQRRILKGQVVFGEGASRKMAEGEKPQGKPLCVAMATRKLLALALQPLLSSFLAPIRLAG